MKESHLGLTRRQFFGSAGVVTAAAALTATESAQGETKAVEKANEKLVLDMCKAIEPLEIDKIEPFLADNFVFQLIDGQPLIEGKEAFLKFLSGFIGPFKRAEFIVERSHVIGNLVINERLDHFYAKEGGGKQTFHVSGFCFVKDGKIIEWKDYRLPA